MTDLTIAPGGSALVHVLHDGYVGRDGDDERVAGTVTLILDGDAVIVVDPGMVASRDALLAALVEHGPGPGDVTDVVFSHHHPDHTVNAALFPAARIHDHWAMYVGDRWFGRDADGLELAPSVRLLRTPGHTAEDISTLAATASDVVVCTHASLAVAATVEMSSAVCPGVRSSRTDGASSSPSASRSTQRSPTYMAQ